MSEAAPPASERPPALFPLWHIARTRDWEDALAAGEYRVSTRGRTLAEEGFIHASYPHHVGAVARLLYADDPEPLVIVEIDRTVLAAHGVVVRTESVPGSQQRFPHLYGPLPVAAVVSTRPVAFDEGGTLVIGTPTAFDPHQ